MEIFDVSTDPPTLVPDAGRGDFKGTDGRRHPRQAVERWSQDDWAKNAGTMRPFALVEATAPEGERITTRDHVFDLTVWPHQRREVIVATEPLPTVEVFIPDWLVRERVEAIGKALAVGELIDALPADQRWTLSTLREGLSPDDPRVRGLLNAAGLTPEEIDQVLAP